MMIYLDHNASAPLLDSARDAMIDALAADANPSSVHRAGRAARAIVQKARRQVAGLVNVRPDHVVFTSGATEAANMVLTPRWSMGRSPVAAGHLYVCAADHPCTLAGGRFPADAVTRVPVKSSGLIDLDALEQLLKAHDTQSGFPLVAVHWANNETGVIQPVHDIHALALQHGGTLVVDAVQAAGRLPIDMDANPPGDHIIVSAHKIGGPRGVGALVSAADLMMPMPLITGGGQERGHRGGTEAPHNLAGFGAAAKAAAEGLDAFNALAQKRDRLEQGIRTLWPDAIIHGEAATRLANTSFVTLPGIKAETLQIALDLEGIAVSSGSACSSGKVGASHVLEAMGAASPDGATRFSLGPQTGDDDVSACLAALEKVLRRAA